jgi:hypothetical protein
LREKVRNFGNPGYGPERKTVFLNYQNEIGTVSVKPNIEMLLLLNFWYEILA